MITSYGCDAKVQKINETTKESFRLLHMMPPIEDEDALYKGCRLLVMGY